MKQEKILFITYDLSGYYKSVYEELCRQYQTVDFYDLSAYDYKYKNFFEKAHSFLYKITTGEKLKNYYRYLPVINQVKDNTYDITVIVRPDLLTNSHLKAIRKASKYFIAYYHDSVNNIKRKEKILHYFDKVFSYEKADVEKYGFQFVSNFIYWDNQYQNTTKEFEVYSVMSHDYRFPTLKKVALLLKEMGISFQFHAITHKDLHDDLIKIDSKRITNDEIIAGILKSNVILDIHKYGVQDGLTYRVFEALGFRKKLITTNKDVRTYDFYNPNNIFVIEDVNNISIPKSFFETPFEEVSPEINAKYTVKAFIETVFNTEQQHTAPKYKSK